MKKKIFVSLAVLAFILPACVPNVPSEDFVFVNEDKVKEITKGGTIYNLNDFQDKFMTEKGNYMSETTPYRTRATKDGNVYIFSIDTLPSTGEGIYIRGRVATDDYGGNFYKSLIIQQIVDGKQQTLRISLDMGSANGMFHQGQEILIHCNGLAIGRYANEPQLCIPSYNNNVYAGAKANEKIGWAPGRIPSPMFRKAVTLIGKPDKSKIVYEELTPAELNTKYLNNYADIAGCRKSDGNLVRVKGVHFNGMYDQYGTPTPCSKYNPAVSDSIGNPELDSNAPVFGPTTGNVGYPQSRYVTDGSIEFLVSTSEYAKYAYFYIPEAQYIGSITGVLGYYYDNAKYDPDGSAWSVTPNNIADILPETQKEGAEPHWVPQEWAKGTPQPGI